MRSSIHVGARIEAHPAAVPRIKGRNSSALSSAARPRNRTRMPSSRTERRLGVVEGPPTIAHVATRPVERPIGPHHLGFPSILRVRGIPTDFSFERDRQRVGTIGDSLHLARVGHAYFTSRARITRPLQGVELALVLLQGHRVPARLPSHQSTASQALLESAGEGPAPAAARARPCPQASRGTASVRMACRIRRARRWSARPDTGYVAPGSELTPHRGQDTGCPGAKTWRSASENGNVTPSGVDSGESSRGSSTPREPGALRARATTRGRTPRRWPAATPWKG